MWRGSLRSEVDRYSTARTSPSQYSISRTGSGPVAQVIVQEELRQRFGGELPRLDVLDDWATAEVAA